MPDSVLMLLLQDDLVLYEHELLIIHAVFRHPAAHVLRVSRSLGSRLALKAYHVLGTVLKALYSLPKSLNNILR